MSRAKSRARFSDLRSWYSAGPQIGLVLIMGATAQLNVAHRGFTTVGVRHDVMEFQKARFGAASLFSAKCALSAVAHPHVTFDRGRNVTRPRVRRTSIFRELRLAALRLRLISQQ